MIGIHQSQFLPWVPYFFKVLKSDVFVVLDDVQFQKNGLQNRNKIKTPRGEEWFTVPVRFDFGDPINKVQIADPNVLEKLLKTLMVNYKKSSFFEIIYEYIKTIFSSGISNLNDLNMGLFQSLFKKIESRTEIRFSSQMNLKEEKDDRLIEIIKDVGENEYLSGKGALNYMDLGKFKSAAIKVYVFDFKYVEYRQLWIKEIGFVPDLSIIDLLFNNLEEAKEYILTNGNIRRIV